MAQQIDWAAKQRYARSLTKTGLLLAIEDCIEASLTVPEVALGKDASYYRDEASVYRTELARRR